MGNGAFWIGMFVGGLLGAAVGVTCAPKPGEQTREAVLEEVQKIVAIAADQGRRLWACCQRESEEARAEREIGFA